jgi:twitching motility protein PilT
MQLDAEAEKVLLDWGLIHNALSQGASDLHISVGAPPMARIHGELVRMEPEPMTAEEVQRLVTLLTDRILLSKFYGEDPQDLDYTVEFPTLKRRFRMNIFRQYHGISIVMRVLAHKVASFDELGLPKAFEKLAFEHSGLVLVTGATGSGKSTTLASMIELINRRQRRHIITIEDPIEILFENKMALIEQREIGTHVSSFAGALRSALREDPDVILVGEIRDSETAMMTLRAAQVGALVMATLHTRSAMETISRFLSMFEDSRRVSAKHQISDCLRGIMCQKLVPRKNGKGRVPACEVLIGTTAVRHMVREDRTHLLHSLMEIASNDGMLTMEQALINGYRQGDIDLSVAFENCNDKHAFLSQLEPELQAQLQIPWETEVELKRLEQMRETRQRQLMVRTV